MPLKLGLWDEMILIVCFSDFFIFTINEMFSWKENEEGKIIVYTTSMGGIRSTVEECAYIRKLFDNLGLKVDERDIFMHKDYQCQLDKRLGIQNASVPYVFINGNPLGVRLTIYPVCLI